MPRTVGLTRSADHGLYALNYCGNGRYAVQQAMTHISQALNGCVTNRLRVLAAQAWPIGTSPSRNFGGRFHTGVNVSNVIMRLMCGPSDSTSTAVTPSIDCAINDGGGAVTNTLYPGTRGTSAIELDKLYQLSALFDVDPMTSYNWSVAPTTNAQVVSVVVQEWFASNILTETTADTGVLTDPSFYRTGGEITVRSLGDANVQIDQLWKRQASIYFADSFDDQNLGGIGVTSATDVNLFDFTKTTYSDDDPGYIIFPDRHARFGTNNVSAHMYAYLQGTAASNATLKFVGQGGTYGTLTYSGTPGMFTGTATLNDSYAQDTIVLLANRGSSGTLEVRQVGLFAYET